MKRVLQFDRLQEGSHQKTMCREVDERLLLDGETLFRTVCHVFALDPFRTKLDVAASMRGIGSLRGDGHASGRRDGLVLFWDEERREHVPIGKLMIKREGERVHDVDCLDPRDFYDMNKPQ